MKDLSKLKQRWYFFDKDENEELIQILKNHLYGEYIKIFDIEVTNDHFKFNTLWRFDECFANEIRKFSIQHSRDKVLFNRVYDFLIQKEIRSERILKLREIGI
jgi:hypothetical protein